MGKYSKIVNSKNQPENQKAVNAENYQAGNLENIKDRKPWTLDKRKIICVKFTQINSETISSLSHPRK